MKRWNNIIILCTYENLITMYKKVLHEMDIDIDIAYIGNKYRMDMTKLLNHINNFKDLGKDIIITRGFLAQLIKENLDFKVVKNKYPNRGISESIKLGIKNCEESEGYMFFVGDQPLLDKKDIEKLINVFNEDTSFIVIPKYKNRFGNPVIYPKKYKEDILNLEGDKGGKSIIKSSDKIKYVDVCENTLFDIDNIDDFYNLLKRETVYEK